MIGEVEMGYDNTDLAKRGAYSAIGIRDMYDQVYSQHSSETIVFGIGVDYLKDQQKILDTHRALADSRWSAYGTAYGRSGSGANTWLTNMYESPGVCPNYNLYLDGTDPEWAFYDDLHLWRRPQVFLLPRNPAELAFGGLFAGLLDRANEWAYELGADNYNSSNRLLLSWDEVEMDMTQINGNTGAKIQMVKDFRKITMDSGINIYMYGWLFTQLEIFIDLEWYFWACCACSMGIVFLVSLLLGLSFLGAGLIAGFAVGLCCQLYGFLYAFDIWFRELAAAPMLMSIGIAVEFVAHTVAAFEFASGSRDKRLAKALEHTCIPVIFGAVSSLLGFVFLAPSDFEFVRKYFFWTFFMICVFGIINGLIFLPGLLGIIGSSKSNVGGRTEAIRRKVEAMSPGGVSYSSTAHSAPARKEGGHEMTASETTGDAA